MDTVPPSSKITVIGVGNEHRGDDGVGRAIARRLRLESENLEILEESGEGASLIDSWQGSRFVILVDAVRSGAPPGTIHRFDAHTETIPESFFNYSTHGFSVAEAVELARVLDQLPQELIVFGIEGQNFDSGNELTPAVKEAEAEVIQQILQIQNKQLSSPDPNHLT